MKLRRLAGLVAALTIAVVPALAAVSPAQAAPKGTLKGDRVGLTPGQDVALTLTNYPAEDVLVKYCVLTGSALAVGDCHATTQTVTVPNSADGRGNASATLAATQMIGANDCTTATMCGFVTESASVTKNADSNVKMTVAFGAKPKLQIMDVAPSGAENSPVTVKGTGFRPGTTLRLTQCKGTDSNQNCRADTVTFNGYSEPTTDSNGAFETTLKVSQSYTSGSTTIDCLVDGCSVQTSSKTSGADATQQVETPAELEFVTLTASKTTGINKNGETITVTGANFKPSTNLYLALCDVDVPAGGACDMTRFKTVTTDGSGGFSQAITVGSFAGTDCLVRSCGIQTSSQNNPTDATQQATLPLAFSSPPAALTASKTTGINVNGETITVTGANYAPSTPLYLSLCDVDVPAGGACDMTRFKTVTTDGSGGFSQAITVGSFAGTDCLVKNCGLQTSKVGGGADVTQQATLPLTFVVPPPALTAGKTSGISTAGETITVSGSGFKPNISLFLANCNTAIPAGAACDMGNFKTVTTNANGDFPATAIKVVGSFTGSDASAVNCLTAACGLQTSRVGQGSDVSQSVTLPLSFVATTQSAKPAITAPPVVKSGTKVRVTGSNFSSGDRIVTALCKKSAKVTKKCGKAKTVKVKADGSFAVKVKVAKKFKSKQGTVKCGKAKCAIKTWNKKHPKQAASRLSFPVKFAGKGARGLDFLSAAAMVPTVVTADGGATLSVSKTSGLSAAGETVTIKGSGFAPGISLYIALCNTSVPAGAACDMGNFKTAKVDGTGAFSGISIKVVGSFTAGDGSSVNCMNDPCGLQSSRVGQGSDSTQAVTVGMKFTTATSGGGSNGTGKGSTSGTTKGNGSGGSGSGSSSGSGDVLPQIGAGSYLWISVTGLLMIVGGVALRRRSAAALG